MPCLAMNALNSQMIELRIMESIDQISCLNQDPSLKYLDFHHIQKKRGEAIRAELTGLFDSGTFSLTGNHFQLLI